MNRIRSLTSYGVLLTALVSLLLTISAFISYLNAKDMYADFLSTADLLRISFQVSSILSLILPGKFFNGCSSFFRHSASTMSSVHISFALYVWYLIRFIFTLRGKKLWRWMYYPFHVAVLYTDCRIQPTSRRLNCTYRNAISLFNSTVLWTLHLCEPS